MNLANSKRNHKKYFWRFWKFHDESTRLQEPQKNKPNILLSKQASQKCSVYAHRYALLKNKLRILSPRVRGRLHEKDPVGELLSEHCCTGKCSTSHVLDRGDVWEHLW